MIISSFADDPAELFEGYCFSGSDYIAEAEGHRSYLAAGGDIHPGLDGCYAVVRNAGEAIEVGTDSRGMRRLFLFDDSSAWAVGTSLHELVEHLRLHGIDPEPCLPVLSVFGTLKSFSAQQNTLQTMFRGITLVPSYCNVRIDAAGPRAVPRPDQVEKAPYEDMLRSYVETWLSRFQTLAAHDDTQFAIDLSGGLDSRVVFAFALASGSLKSLKGRFRIASHRGLPDDFAAAQNIAEKHGVTLNHPRGEVVRGESAVPRAIDSWKNTCLGLYLPLYLSPHQFDPLSIKGHGAGGGTFRDIFSEATLPKRLESLRPVMRDSEHEEYCEIATGDLARIAADRPQAPVGKLLYREFRNRFHFGHAPHRRPMYSPVNSILTDPLADRPGFEPNNIYYDALDCLVPGLKNEPYDKPSKSPAESRPSTAAARIGKVEGHPGAVHAPDPLARTKPASPRGAFNEIYAAAQHCVKEEGVREIIRDRGVIDRCESAIDRVLSADKPPRANHQDHKDVSFVLAAAFAAGLPLGEL